MQKYKLIRVMQYTEELEVEVATYGEARKIINSDEINFTRNEDDIMYDSSIEYLGEDCE